METTPVIMNNTLYFLYNNKRLIKPMCLYNKAYIYIKDINKVSFVDILFILFDVSINRNNVFLVTETYSDKIPKYLYKYFGNILFVNDINIQYNMDIKGDYRNGKN